MTRTAFAALAVFLLARTAFAGGDEAADPLAGLAVPATVVSVYDGDTLTVDAHPWPGITIRTGVRLLGLDTPEIKGGCPEERAAALRARDRLAALAGPTVILTGLGHDKYGGRIDARVRSIAGEDLAAVLIAERLALPYDGGTKPDWCRIFLVR